MIQFIEIEARKRIGPNKPENIPEAKRSAQEHIERIKNLVDTYLKPVRTELIMMDNGPTKVERSRAISTLVKSLTDSTFLKSSKDFYASNSIEGATPQLQPTQAVALHLEPELVKEVINSAENSASPYPEDFKEGISEIQRASLIITETGGYLLALNRWQTIPDHQDIFDTYLDLLVDMDEDGRPLPFDEIDGNELFHWLTPPFCYGSTDYILLSAGGSSETTDSINALIQNGTENLLDGLRMAENLVLFGDAQGALVMDKNRYIC